jgi:hypothetical protein
VHPATEKALLLSLGLVEETHSNSDFDFHQVYSFSPVLQIEAEKSNE